MATFEDESDEIAALVMQSYGITPRRRKNYDNIRQAVADAAQIGLERSLRAARRTDPRLVRLAELKRTSWRIQEAMGKAERPIYDERGYSLPHYAELERTLREADDAIQTIITELAKSEEL